MIVTQEDRQELRAKLERANNILEEYGIKLSYDQYTADYSKAMEPHLYLRCGVNLKDVDGRRISIEILKDEKWENGEKCPIAFYLADFHYESKTLQESIEHLAFFQKMLQDISQLNQTGLWVSKNLVRI